MGIYKPGDKVRIKDGLIDWAPERIGIVMSPEEGGSLYGNDIACRLKFSNFSMDREPGSNDSTWAFLHEIDKIGLPAIIYYGHTGWGGRWTIQYNDDSICVSVVDYPLRWEAMQFLGWEEKMSLPLDNLVYFEPWEPEHSVLEPYIPIIDGELYDLPS